MKHKIRFRLNGENVEIVAEPQQTLLAVLRDYLNHYGTRETCGIGICGVCSVLVDGRLLSACLLLAPQVDGCDVETIEGLSRDGNLQPLQQAFLEKNAFQCGYCTPGMILAAKSLLAENPNPGKEEIRRYLSGNLCRCGSYYKIIEAVQLAAENMKHVDR